MPVLEGTILELFLEPVGTGGCPLLSALPTSIPQPGQCHSSHNTARLCNIPTHSCATAMAPPQQAGTRNSYRGMPPEFLLQVAGGDIVSELHETSPIPEHSFQDGRGS